MPIIPNAQRRGGDENVGVKLDGVRHDAGGLSLMGLDCNLTLDRAPDLRAAGGRVGDFPYRRKILTGKRAQI